jgi:hypothetical protein
MAPSAHRSPARDAYGPYAAYGHYDHEPGYAADWDVLPGERVGPPPRRRRGKFVLLGLMAAIGLSSWGLMSGQLVWPAWLPTDPAVVLTWFERTMPAAVERTAPAAPARLEPTPELTTIEVPPRPASARESVMQPAAEKPAPPLTTGSLPPGSMGDDRPGEPLPPVTPDPADPYQVKAAAVGLHPGLSRVLLARLSAADYRNAGIAIETALAETPDSGVHIGPRQRKPELALFRVSFVPGAPSGCRRYVVAITKDRWVTTALPMEKCGRQPRQVRRE